MLELVSLIETQLMRIKSKKIIVNILHKGSKLCSLSVFLKTLNTRVPCCRPGFPCCHPGSAKNVMAAASLVACCVLAACQTIVVWTVARETVVVHLCARVKAGTGR